MIDELFILERYSQKRKNEGQSIIFWGERSQFAGRRLPGLGEWLELYYLAFQYKTKAKKCPDSLLTAE